MIRQNSRQTTVVGYLISPCMMGATDSYSKPDRYTFDNGGILLTQDGMRQPAARCSEASIRKTSPSTNTKNFKLIAPVVPFARGTAYFIAHSVGRCLQCHVCLGRDGLILSLSSFDGLLASFRETATDGSSATTCIKSGAQQGHVDKFPSDVMPALLDLAMRTNPPAAENLPLCSVPSLLTVWRFAQQENCGHQFFGYLRQVPPPDVERGEHGGFGVIFVQLLCASMV